MSKKKKTHAKKNKAARARRKLWIAITVLTALLCLLVLFALSLGEGEDPDFPEAPIQTTGPAREDTVPTTIPASTQTQPPQTSASANTDLGHDVQLLEVGKYTGMFMEDGSDEIISGVLMLKIINNGDEAIQYAEITMSYGGETARFTVTTLLPGATMILLEQDRMAYSVGAVRGEAEMKNVAVFREPLSLCEDKLEIQVLDGAINVTNISGEDITGDVRIYYKNCADGIYYGGITYMLRIQGGIPAEGIKQLTASHFSDTGSVIMFVTCG